MVTSESKTTMAVNRFLTTLTRQAARIAIPFLHQVKLTGRIVAGGWRERKGVGRRIKNLRRQGAARIKIGSRDDVDLAPV